MATYKWFDTEEWGESDAVEFEADSVDDAKHKAARMFMGEIGEQHEYDLPMTIINCDTGEKHEFNVHIDMSPEFFFEN